jgi:hypothetical protein
VRQVIEALGRRGPSTPDELAATIYTEVPEHLLPMAARNVRANLDLLASEQRVQRLEGDRWRLVA